MLKSLELLDLFGKNDYDIDRAIAYLIGFLGQDIDQLSDNDFKRLKEGLATYEIATVEAKQKSEQP